MLNGTSEVKMEIELLKESDGVELYRLKNSNGMTATITNYGARIVTLCPFDKNGNAVDVVAGFDTPQGFMGDNPYFNAVIGRVCNRIGGATEITICTAERKGLTENSGKLTSTAKT